LDQGQGAPQVVAFPPGQMTGGPAAQSTMSQAWVPAKPAGHKTTHCAPAAQVEWQGEAEQVNVQVLPAPQTHWPLAHVPLHWVLAAQVT
jgi:hypothetical protein